MRKFLVLAAQRKKIGLLMVQNDLFQRIGYDDCVPASPETGQGFSHFWKKAAIFFSGYRLTHPKQRIHFRAEYPPTAGAILHVQASLNPSSRTNWLTDAPAGRSLRLPLPSRTD